MFKYSLSPVAKMKQELESSGKSKEPMTPGLVDDIPFIKIGDNSPLLRLPRKQS